MSRITPNYPLRQKLLIVTNGARTEKNYFKLIKEKRSEFDIDIKIENGSPIRVVEFALKFLNKYFEIWCVFDIDNSFEEKQLIEAIRLAKQNKIKIAYSNLSFEVWLISHFKECSSFYNMKDLYEILNKYLKKFNSKLEYDKGDESILEKYFIPNYKSAIQNSRTVLQRLKKSHNKKSRDILEYPIWKRNSSTSVYLLLERLKLQK